VSNFVAMATWVGPFKISLTLLDSLIPKSPAKRTNLGDISYTSRVIANFFSNFIAMATGVGRGKIWLALFNSTTRKPIFGCKDIRVISYTSRLTAHFVPNFVAMATGCNGIVTVEFVFRRSIARPWKPPVIREDLGDISYRPSYIPFCRHSNGGWSW